MERRFSKRTRELNERAQLLEDLARTPELAPAGCFSRTADLMRGAASDLDELVKATPPGCICRRVNNDNYSYLDYAEECLHHRQLYALSARLKADYARMERALKDETRMKLVVATLSGAATSMAAQAEHLHGAFVENALTLADEVIRRITEIA